MNLDRLDIIARRLATSRRSGVTSRRLLLRGAAAAGAGLLAGRQPTSAACPPGSVAGAGGRCRCTATGRPPVGGVCPCPAGRERCGEVLRRHAQRLAELRRLRCGLPGGEDLSRGECSWDGTIVSIVNNGPEDVWGFLMWFVLPDASGTVALGTGPQYANRLLLPGGVPIDYPTTPLAPGERACTGPIVELVPGSTPSWCSYSIVGVGIASYGVFPAEPIVPNRTVLLGAEFADINNTTITLSVHSADRSPC